MLILLFYEDDISRSTQSTRTHTTSVRLSLVHDRTLPSEWACAKKVNRGGWPVEISAREKKNVRRDTILNFGERHNTLKVLEAER